MFKKLCLMSFLLLHIFCNDIIAVDPVKQDESTSELTVAGAIATVGFLTAFTYITCFLGLKAMSLCCPEVHDTGKFRERFSDVGGNKEAKEVFKDIIECLNNQEFYRSIGAKPPRGVLLSGNPGSGKTLLMGSLVGEAKCKFIYTSGAALVTSGITGIKQLFFTALNQFSWTYQSIPCIILIEDLDILMADYACWNYMLTYLDRLEEMERSSVVIVAATSHLERIDKSILRPGRIDRVIDINHLDCSDRLDILKIHLKKVTRDISIDLKKIAQSTEGFNAEELEDIIVSAARIAADKKSDKVCQKDIQEAYEAKVFGYEKKCRLSQKQRELVAYHEAGHALSSMLLMPEQVVNKVTILPRGSSLGFTHFLPEDDMINLHTKDSLLNYIAVALAGRAAEELIFNTVTTGPSDDLKKAKMLVESMMRYYGMGEDLVVETNTSFDVKKEDIAKVLDEQYQRVKNILKNNIDSLHVLAKKLLEKETLVDYELNQLALV